LSIIDGCDTATGQTVHSRFKLQSRKINRRYPQIQLRHLVARLNHKVTEAILDQPGTAIISRVDSKAMASETKVMRGIS
jgi:hypothetical protein